MYEDAQIAAALKRKNSAATELIESLTSAFVARNSLIAPLNDSVSPLNTTMTSLVKSASAGDEATAIGAKPPISGGGGSLTSGICRRAESNDAPIVNSVEPTTSSAIIDTISERVTF